MWIDVPDQWYGRHAHKRDEAVEAAEKAGLPPTQANFAIAMNLLDNWNIPQLGGNPKEWDFANIRLELITWVTATTLAAYQLCFIIPKKNLTVLPAWLPETETETAVVDGTETVIASVPG